MAADAGDIKTMILGPSLAEIGPKATEAVYRLQSAPESSFPRRSWLPTEGEEMARVLAIRLPHSPPLLSPGNTKDGSIDLVGLEQQGVLLVRDSGEGVPGGSEVRLSGGSVCRTVLHSDTLEIHKTVQPNALPVEDGVERHVREFTFMSELPDDYTYLFPEVISAAVDSATPNLKMKFLPGYSVGERVVRREISRAELIETVDYVADALHDHMWSREVRASLARNYFDIVQRRFQSLRGLAEFDGVWTVGASLNGTRVPPLSSLLKSSRQAWPSLACIPKTPGHGDLILEDVVLTAKGRGTNHPKLVDPNPGGTSCLGDLAKLYMSLDGKYELLYADQFELSRSRTSNGELEIELRLTNLGSVNLLNEAADHLRSRIPSWMRDQDSIDVRNSVELVEVHSALNMLSLPSFHMIHHDQVDRALAFVVLGAQKLAQQLNYERRI